MIVPEVEIELRSSRKFGGRFDGTIRKAIGNGTIVVLDHATLMAHLTALGMPAASANATCSMMQSLGSQYYRRVGLGEAYTFAAGVVLQVPAISNDNDAITVLSRAVLQSPSPVLRVFDLIAFAYQISLLTEKVCDRFRSALLKEREGLPAEFKNASFVDGVNHCRVRLCDGAASSIGLPCANTPPHVKRLTVERYP